MVFLPIEPNWFSITVAVMHLSVFMNFVWLVLLWISMDLYGRLVSSSLNCIHFRRHMNLCSVACQTYRASWIWSPFIRWNSVCYFQLASENFPKFFWTQSIHVSLKRISRLCFLSHLKGSRVLNETEFLVRQSQGSTIGYNCISLLDFLRKACNVSHIFLILLLHI